MQIKSVFITLITETINNPTQSPSNRPSFSPTISSDANQREAVVAATTDAPKDDDNGIIIIYNEEISVMSLILFAAAMCLIMFACACLIGIFCYKRGKRENLKADVVKVKSNSIANEKQKDAPQPADVDVQTPKSKEDSDNLSDVLFNEMIQPTNDGILETMMATNYSRSIGSDLLQTMMTTNYSRSIGSELFKIDNDNDKKKTVTSNNPLAFTEEGGIGDV